MWGAWRTWHTGANDNPREAHHAVSNHDRRLAAEAGMAGRAQYAVGALEIQRRGTGAGQARRHHAGGQTAGRRRHRHRHRGRAGAPAFCPWLHGEDRGHRFRPQGRDGNPQRPLQGDGAAGGGAAAAEGPRPCRRGPRRPHPHRAKTEIHPARPDDHHRYRRRRLLWRPRQDGVRLCRTAQRGSQGLAGRRRRHDPVRRARLQRLHGRGLGLGHQGAGARRRGPDLRHRRAHLLRLRHQGQYRLEGDAGQPNGGSTRIFFRRSPKARSSRSRSNAAIRRCRWTCWRCSPARSCRPA